MRALCVIFAAASVVTVAAVDRSAAADIPAPAPMVAASPLSPVSYAWSGFYVGVHAGYGWSDGDTTIGITDPTGVAQTIAAAGGFPLRYSYDRSGYVAGGQLGFNYQTGPWVWGLEGDISATGIDGAQTTVLPACPICTLPNSSTVSQSMDWFATLRARAGYAVNNWLFYGTAGVAFADVKYSYLQTNVPFGGALNSAGTDNQTEIGWTGGFGVEYGWGPWSAKVEYLYYDLGDRTFVVPHNLVPTVVQFNPKFENHGSIVRGGVNYRFTAVP
jgi:outer membrane immunogenic protein